MSIKYRNGISNKLEDPEILHREGVRWCPYCEFKGNDHIWFLEEYVIEVVFNHKFCYHNACIVLSHCSSCQEISWMHYKINHLIEVVKNIEYEGKKSISLKKLRKHNKER